MLSIGDIAPYFTLCSPLPFIENWNPRELLDQAIILFFYRDIQDIIPLKDYFLDLKQHNLTIIGVHSDNLEIQNDHVQKHQLPFLLLADINEQIALAYGVESLKQPVIFLVNTNRRIIKIYQRIDSIQSIFSVLEDCKTLIKPTVIYNQIITQAPVLVIPNFLDEAFCKYLIEVLETQGNVYSQSGRQGGDQLIDSVNYQFMKRREHFLVESDLKEIIKPLIYHKICPEIERAFNFRVTRYEGFSIVCYLAEEGGYLNSHRDNEVEIDAHRRFAISINLNAGEYDGAFLEFPEYHASYRTTTGDAIIFSTSLLHKVTPVTQGKRLTLFGWLFGEEDATKAIGNQRLGGELLFPDASLSEILFHLKQLNITVTASLLQKLKRLKTEEINPLLSCYKALNQFDKIECGTGFLEQSIEQRFTYGKIPENPKDFEICFNLACDMGLIIDCAIMDHVLHILTPEEEWFSWEQFFPVFYELSNSLQ